MYCSHDATLPRRPPGRRLIRLGLVLLVLMAAGCAIYRPVNVPLSHWRPDYGYRAARAQAAQPMGDVLLVLAFSGGGTRAAALSYGVLQELRDTRVVVDGVEKRLLDEVDLITAVSGGSFTAAYYGVYGDRIFVDFETRFLRRNIQRRLLLQVVRPRNWIRLASTFFDRSELAVQLYDDEIFGHATFADLQAAGGPFVHINATDLAGGNHFTFFQPQFDLICSDLSQLKIARAVAASSAVPGLFTPITLRSYAGQCGFDPPAWLEEAGTARTGSLRRLRNAQIVQGYLRGNRQYIHLVDGGIADNLGLRVPLDNVILVGGLRQRFDQLGGARPVHIMVVVANAEVHREPAFSLTAATPSLGRMLSAVSGVQISSYNFETLELMRQSLQNWANESPPDAYGRRAQTYLPVIAFESLEAREERAYFNALPTSFYLEDEAVDRLIALGRRLLRESPEFQRFMAALQAEVGRAPVEDMTRTAGGTAAARP